MNVWRRLNNIWHVLTVPHSVDEGDARREYSVKVIIGFSTIVIALVLPLLVIGRLVAPDVITLDMPLAAGIFIVLLGGSWLLAFRGHWRFSSYIPPGIVFSLAIRDTFVYGLGATNIVEFTLAIVLSIILLPKKVWWIIVFLSLGVSLLLEGRSLSMEPDRGYEDLLYWTVMLILFYTLLVFLLRFLVQQYQEALSKTNALTDELKTRIEKHEQAEHELQESLEKNRILIGELYHRTKNSMQVICSFLDVQTYYLEDEYLIKELDKIETRIQSMALVHQKLLESEDLSHINIGEYVEDLTYFLCNDMDVDPTRIFVSFDTQEIFVIIDTAIPCGLIITELVTNAIQHAFPEQRSGKIMVMLHKGEDEVIHIRVEDNGIGMPHTVELGGTKTLGLPLVIDLVESQLRGEVSFGEVSFGTEHGFACDIYFKDILYMPRL